MHDRRCLGKREPEIDIKIENSFDSFHFSRVIEVAHAGNGG